MAHELTGSGVAVTDLFWRRWKLRSRERKWLMCLCVFLYIDTHATCQRAFGTMRPRGQLALDRLQHTGWGGEGAGHCREDRWHRAAPQRRRLLVPRGHDSLCSATAKTKQISNRQNPSLSSIGPRHPAERGWPWRAQLQTLLPTQERRHTKDKQGGEHEGLNCQINPPQHLPGQILNCPDMNVFIYAVP